jgi:hypothetical protein
MSQIQLGEEAFLEVVFDTMGESSVKFWKTQVHYEHQMLLFREHHFTDLFKEVKLEAYLIALLILVIVMFYLFVIYLIFIHFHALRVRKFTTF